jgi:hypothetical protein
MSVFISNNLIGWIGGFYEKMRPAEFGQCARQSPPAETFLSCYSAIASVGRSNGDNSIRVTIPEAVSIAGVRSLQHRPHALNRSIGWAAGELVSVESIFAKQL